MSTTQLATVRAAGGGAAPAPSGVISASPWPSSPPRS